ncbi:MAG TPA: SRPBCC domain-containing protein [Dyella sp.]|uniref:SRPBCC domain-containing protein n=1 Tax=Dyella sp. TaxID=1869338 RepID=UPI002D7A28EE|nr:SRPBCC domain-containing protein [Dyella sp.]HET6553059.1 SRPBCC domain-containing protein [Dyella sp.]
MNTPALRSLRITRHFDASAERVFDAWLDPATAGRWLFATEQGEMVRVDIDARVGGHFRFIRRDGEDVEHVGEYLEIDRPRRLVFTFAVPRYSEAVTRVSVDITPANDGCDLVLTHEDVLPDWADATQQGWGMILGHLDENLQRHLPREHPATDTVQFERLLPGPIERVWSYLMESDKRALWLGAGSIEPRVGSTFELRFHHSELSETPLPPPDRYARFSDGVSTQHRVTVLDPPRRFACTWGNLEQPSEVTFELTPKGDDVLLVVTHRRLAAADMAGTSGGWHTHLDVLADRLAGRKPQPFWPVFEHHQAYYEATRPS